MLKTSIKNNLKTILRDPTTILAILAAVIMQFIDGFDWYTGPDGSYVDTELYLSERTAVPYILQTARGWVVKPIRTLLFPFIGVIIAVNLFKDRKTGMFDVISAGQIKFRQYFLSKILSYYIISVSLCTVLTVVYAALYIIIQVPQEPLFEWYQVFITQAVAMLVSYTSCLWVPIAWVMFWSILTGIPAVGAIFSAVYRYIPLLFTSFSFSFWESFVHLYPTTLSMYLQSWIRFPFLEFMERKYSGIEPYWSYTSFPDAVLCYGIQIGIATTLFAVSYFIWKGRVKKG